MAFRKLFSFCAAAAAIVCSAVVMAFTHAIDFFAASAERMLEQHFDPFAMAYGDFPAPIDPALATSLRHEAGLSIRAAPRNI